MCIDLIYTETHIIAVCMVELEGSILPRAILKMIIDVECKLMRGVPV